MCVCHGAVCARVAVCVFVLCGYVCVVCECGVVFVCMCLCVCVRGFLCVYYGGCMFVVCFVCVECMCVVCVMYMCYALVFTCAYVFYICTHLCVLMWRPGVQTRTYFLLLST